MHTHESKLLRVPALRLKAPVNHSVFRKCPGTGFPLSVKRTELPLILASCCLFLMSCTAEPDFGEPPDLSRFGETSIGQCPQYNQSDLYRSRSNTVIVSPDMDWISAIENASADTEILLENGNYLLDQYALQLKDQLTLRSLSSNPASVNIQGMGYGIGSEGLMVSGNQVTIADVSITDFRDHGIVANPHAGAQQGLQLYNLNIADIGTQHIKVNPGGARDGLIACSTIGYSDGAAVGDYNGAIDLHGTVNYLIRDNYIYNITGDGSGCLIDQDCGQYISAPAILAWNGASGTDVIGNTIVDSFRNIAFGLGSSHNGGRILHNSIVQSSPGDAGIELYNARNAVVEYNTVLLAGRYPGTIEFRHSDNLSITNNWLSQRPWDRGGNVNVQLAGNAFRVIDSPRLPQSDYANR